MVTIKSDADHNPVERLSRQLNQRLIGTPVPANSLPWTTYANLHNELGPGANTSLAAIGGRGLLVVYFCPSETEGCYHSDSMGRAFRDHDNAMGRLGANIVGVSSQPALDQQEVATTELFPQLLLADERVTLADILELPTIQLGGRREYQPLTMIVLQSHILHVIYPISSPRAHIKKALRWIVSHT